MELTIKCSKCGEVKGAGEFYKNKGKKNGLASWCKACKTAYEKTEPHKKYLRKRYKQYKQSDKYKAYIEDLNNSKT